MSNKKPSASASGPSHLTQRDGESPEEYIRRCTTERCLLPTQTLVRLAGGPGLREDQTSRLAILQYDLALQRDNSAWIHSLRRDVRFLSRDAWINRNIPTPAHHSTRPPQRSTSSTASRGRGSHKQTSRPHRRSRSRSPLPGPRSNHKPVVAWETDRDPSHQDHAPITEPVVARETDPNHHHQDHAPSTEPVVAPETRDWQEVRIGVAEEQSSTLPHLEFLVQEIPGCRLAPSC